MNNPVSSAPTLNGEFYGGTYIIANLNIHQFGNENYFNTIFLQVTASHSNGLNRLVNCRCAYGLHKDMASIPHDPSNSAGNFTEYG